MAELQERLDKLLLRVDHMGMRVEQAVADALEAIDKADPKAGEKIYAQDAVIDREEIVIEQECIRLLALYQPAAIDLRTICTIIKVNSDLERIADLAASLGRRVKHVAEDKVNFKANIGFQNLKEQVLDVLGRTIRMINTTDPSTAQRVIDNDQQINEAHKHFVRGALDTQDGRIGGVEAVATTIYIAKSLERIADLCTNIAEDVIFLRTGDVVRHANAFMPEAE